MIKFWSKNAYQIVVLNQYVPLTQLWGARLLLYEQRVWPGNHAVPAIAAGECAAGGHGGEEDQGAEKKVNPTYFLIKI